MKLSLYIVCVLLLFPSALLGQEGIRKHAVSVSCGGGIPIGESFLDHVSWVGPQLGYEYVVIPQLRAGASIAYSYGKKQAEMIGDFNGDFVTGNSVRSLSSIPLQLGLTYFPLGGKTLPVQPYLGVNGGLNYAIFHITGDNINSYTSNNWSEVFSANLGVRYYLPGFDRVYLDINGAYQYAGNKLAIVGSDNQQGFLMRIGAGFTF